MHIRHLNSATCHLPPATCPCHLPPATCNLAPATCSKFPVRPKTGRHQRSAATVLIHATCHLPPTPSHQSPDTCYTPPATSHLPALLTCQSVLWDQQLLPIDKFERPDVLYLWHKMQYTGHSVAACHLPPTTCLLPRCHLPWRHLPPAACIADPPVGPRTGLHLSCGRCCVAICHLPPATFQLPPAICHLLHAPAPCHLPPATCPALLTDQSVPKQYCT